MGRHRIYDRAGTCGADHLCVASCMFLWEAEVLIGEMNAGLPYRSSICWHIDGINLLIKKALAKMKPMPAKKISVCDNSLQASGHDLKHIGIFEYEVITGPYTEVRVALYNMQKYVVAEAHEIIQYGDFNDNILTMPKSVWEHLFQNKENP